MAAATKENGDKPKEVAPGIPIDGEFYTREMLNGKEQRELRNVLRELTGNEGATLNQLFEFGLCDDFDVIAAMTYVIRQRTNEKYTLDEALELNPADVDKEAAELLKEKKRRPRKPTASGGEN